jgi:Flp pilus assembly pilin Flp
MRTKASLRRSSNNGSAAIEFGLIAPVLLILLIGLVELGFAVHQAMQVQAAAEAGAIYAGRYGWDQSGIASAVEHATGADNVTADPAPTLFCGCPDAGGVAAAACDVQCPDGNWPGRYARISASMPHVPILTGLGLPIPAVLTGHAVVRVQ